MRIGHKGSDVFKRALGLLITLGLMQFLILISATMYMLPVLAIVGVIWFLGFEDYGS